MEGGQASLVQHGDSVRKPNSSRKRTTVDSVVGKTKRRKTVKNTWSNEDIANVITLVEKNKVLYDTGDGNYHKEKNKRIDVWNGIAIELKLNKTGDDLKLMWTNMRRNFVKKVKEHRGASGNARKVTIEAWPHWESMQFVRDFINPIETTSTLDRAKQARGDGQQFSLLDLTGSDEESGLSGDHGSEAEDEMENPPSVQPSNVSSMSSASKPKRGFSGMDYVRKIADDYSSQELTLQSQSLELTKVLTAIFPKAETQEDKYGSYVAATLTNLQDPVDRNGLRQKIDETIAIFLYQKTIRDTF